MMETPTLFDILYFIKYPPPYPQPARNFYEPKSGAFLPWAWPEHKVGVDLFPASPESKFPETLQGIPVVFPEGLGFSVVGFFPSWRSFRYSRESFVANPEAILKEIHTELIRTANPEPIIRLTIQERRVLRSIAHGSQYRKIASDMKYSIKTISTIATSLKEKFFADSTPALIARAFAMGYLTSEEIYLHATAKDVSKRRQNTVRN